MLRFNEVTREFEEKPVRFMIDGKWRDDDYYMVSIPHHYVDQFEDHAFPDLEIFRRALMFASCAAEARYYNRPHLIAQNEACLKECMER